MKQNAFTLMETLVSVAVVALILALFSGQTAKFRHSIQWFADKTASDEKLLRISKLLYADLLSAAKIEVVQGETKDMLKLTNTVSYYGLDKAVVFWYVLKQDSTLVRAESAKDFTIPADKISEYDIYADKIATNCNKFLLYATDNMVLADVLLQGEKPLNFAVPRVTK